MVGRAHPQEPGCVRRQWLEDGGFLVPHRTPDPDEATGVGEAQSCSGLLDEA